MKKMKNQLMIDGVLLVDKPSDWTSHDVCAFVRKRFRIGKVGHAGTLDPMATGLLVVLLGKATKQSNSLMSCDKDYEGVMELGKQTDSHDRTGQVTATGDPGGVTIEKVRELAAASFTGVITQVPPMVSAIKHQGVRLYKLARKGQDVPREGREVHVHSFDIQEKNNEFISFYTKVSKGTYVRTLIHDMGEKLGCYATLYNLRRIRSGEFHVNDSVTVDQLRGIEPADLRGKILPLSELSQHVCSD